jgi:hypothetical protein
MLLDANRTELMIGILTHLISVVVFYCAVRFGDRDWGYRNSFSNGSGKNTRLIGKRISGRSPE